MAKKETVSPEVKEIKKLNQNLDEVQEHLSKKALFLGSMVRGAGAIAGATLFIIIGGFVLRLMGFLPGLSDIAVIILDAFDKARIH